MSYKVLITTSGIGSRMGEMTRSINKCLIPLGNKPVISHIINSYPKNVGFVITLGYLGEQVKAALQQLFPDRSITFVSVNPYQGPGSSQGYSTLAAKEALQTPFIFHACDTITTDPIPTPHTNWSAGYKLDDNAQYRTLNIKDRTIHSINDKGAPNFDYIHIGLVGIKDYESFWYHLGRLHQDNPENQALNDTDVINAMLQTEKQFTFVPVSTWYDSGNPTTYEQAKKELGQSV